MSDRVCWGIPGGGKTTFGIGLAREWLSRGALPDRVAYLAFTKAAARTAAERISGGGGYEDGERSPYPLFRTIHSLCYRELLRWNSDLKVVTTGSLKQFAKETGLDGAYAVYDWEDLADVYRKMHNQGRTDWDQAMTAYSLSRSMATSEEDVEKAKHEPSGFACQSVGFIENAVYEVFVQKYTEFKAREGLVDFGDMLEWALLNMPPIQAQYAIIDEAQDLCPLHHAIIERAFRDVEERWWIGDDDQALYRFAGASAELFLEKTRNARYQVELRQTRRYGQEVVDFSRRIIRRAEHRHEKEIVGVTGRPGRITLAGQFQPVPGNIFVLHRHVAGCQAAAEAYMQAGIPFRNERGQDPLGAANKIKAWKAMTALGKSMRAPVTQVQILIEDHIPSIQKDEARTRLVPVGAKKRMANSYDEVSSVSLRDLVDGKVLTEAGADIIRNRNYALLAKSENFEYYDRLAANGHDVYEEKVPVITTIHGSKGREAEGVIILSEMGMKCWDDPDTEHRIAYVAATRTKGDVTICTDNLTDWATTKYDYPV